MKKITKITPAQAARMPEFVKKWLDIGLSTEPADFDKATEAALKAYKLCNLDKPMVILRMGSPFGATLGGILAHETLKTLGTKKVQSQVESQVGSQVLSQVLSQVWSQVQSQVESQVRSQVWSQVESQVRSQVRSQVESQVRSQVWSQVESQVRSQVRSQVESQVQSQVQSQVESQVRSQVWSKVESKVLSQVWRVGSQVGSQVWSQVLSQGIYNDRGGNLMYSGWCAYIDFIRGALEWNDAILERHQIDEDLAKSCGWVWWHENILAISDRPIFIKRDDQGRMHCESGPAIAYRDGWALHYWHGVSVPPEWIENKHSLTAEIALTWNNVEQRRAACEIIGWTKILSSLKAKTIDEDGDPEIGTLLEVDLPDSGKEKFLQVLCGTGRLFAIPVPREMKTAIEANSWTWGLKPHEYKPEIRT